MIIFNLATLALVAVVLTTPALLPRVQAAPLQEFKNWEYAVAFDDRIILYDEKWQDMGHVATEFQHISSIVYDEIGDQIYFTDVDKHGNSSIYALGRSPVNPSSYITLATVVEKAHEEEIIHGLAFDPVERSLFWIDEAIRVIYKLDVKQKNALPVLWRAFEHQIPQALAVDVCRRYMYWSTATDNLTTIERATLARGDKHEVLITKDISRPVALEIDQFSSRMFWIDHLQGSHVAVKSADLHGGDQKLVYEAVGRKLRDLMVDQEHLSILDQPNTGLYHMNKTNDATPKKFMNFMRTPNGIIKRSRFADTHGEHSLCESAVDKVVAQHQALGVSTDLAVVSQFNVVCLNGKVDEKGHCNCSDGWTGQHCETRLCQNYCFHGKCTVSSTGIPLCHCDSGYTGERCEMARCIGFCLNEGRCEFENEEPVCHCPREFSGKHCEMINSKPVICRAFCEFQITVPNIDWRIEEVCSCGNGTEAEPVCMVNPGGPLGQTFIYVIVAAVLMTILLIVMMVLGAIRRWYKPVRPKIKKTYVVRKNVTPMTYRPTPAERCEITIENCCNMEYCDTPCFDPKILVKDIDDKNTKPTSMQKDDKRDLLNNIVLDNSDLF